MKSTLFSLFVLAGVPVASASDYTDNFASMPGAVHGVVTDTLVISDSTYSGNASTDKGGVVYVNGGSVNLSGSLTFADNYHYAVINDGSIDDGYDNDIAMASGSSLTATSTITNRLYVNVQSQFEVNMDASGDSDSFTLSGVSLYTDADGKATLSGSISGANVNIVDDYSDNAVADGSIALQNITLIRAGITSDYFEDDTTISATGISLDADSYLNAAARLSGNNSLTLNSDFSDSNQLDGVTLASDATLTLKFSASEQPLTLLLTGLTAEDGATIVSGQNGMTVTEWHSTEDGISVTLAAIPEPTTASLSLLALAAIIARRRRV